MLELMYLQQYKILIRKMEKVKFIIDGTHGCVNVFTDKKYLGNVTLTKTGYQFFTNERIESFTGNELRQIGEQILGMNDHASKQLVKK